MRRAIAVVLLTVCLAVAPTAAGAAASPAVPAESASAGESAPAADATGVAPAAGVAGVAPAADATGVVPVGAADRTVGTTATAATTATPTNGSNTTTVTVLTYNDIQTAAAEDENFPRLVTAIDRRRAAHENPTVVVGAGDQVGPHALSPISQWRAPVDVLNTVDPAADVVGNHEFDYGYDAVSEISDRSAFPWLATNVVNASTGEPFENTTEYVVVERDGVRIGVVGLIDRGAAEGKTNIDFSERGAEVENYTEAGPETAEMLKQQEDVDVVVALAHVGIGDAKRLADADDADAIDVIAVGDDEVKYQPRAEADGTVITEAVGRAQYLGELNLTVDTEADDVVGFDGRLIAIDGSYEKDPEASRIIGEYRAEVRLDSTVANTTTPLDSRFATNYHRESAYGNLITDAMRAETGADVAITNAGGIRSNTVYAPNASADDPVGVTGGDVFNTLPFPNTLVTFELTGSELRAVLASQVVTLESDTGQAFGQEISQQVSGVRFEWVAHEGRDPRIRDLYVNRAGPDEPADWEAVEPDGTYTVTVNSFMAAGGSGYPLPGNKTVVSRTDTLLAVAVIDYLEAQGTVSPAVEGRMQRVDRDLADAEVRVDGAGKVVLTFDRPDDVASLAADTVSITGKAPGVGSVDAEQVVVDDDEDTVVVRFDDPALAEFVGDREGTVELDLYAAYQSSAFGPKRVYFEDSRLNADVTAEVVDKPGREKDDADDDPGRDPGTGTALASAR